MSTSEPNSNAETIAKLSTSIKYVGLTFAATVIVSTIVAVFANGTIFVYAITPFALALWASVVHLSWHTYGLIMAVVAAIVGLLFPPSVILFLLLAYSRASAFLKSQGIKLSLMGSPVNK